MKYTRIVVALCASVLASCAPSKAIDELDFPTAKEWCQDAPWCNFSSVEKKWPGGAPGDKNVPITNLTFSIEVPRAYSKLAVLSGSLPTVAAEYKSYRIVVALEETPDLQSVTNAQNLAEAKRLSNRLPIDVHEIVFTSTPTQAEPKNLYDLWIWRSAFSVKSRSYKSATSGEIYRNGKWNAYVANVDGLNYTRTTVITHRDLPSRYLRILDNGAPKSVIIDMIASVRLDQAPAIESKGNP